MRIEQAINRRTQKASLDATLPVIIGVLRNILAGTTDKNPVPWNDLSERFEARFPWQSYPLLNSYLPSSLALYGITSMVLSNDVQKLDLPSQSSYYVWTNTI